MTKSNHITKERCLLLYLKNLHSFLPEEKMLCAYQLKLLHPNPWKTKVYNEFEDRPLPFHSPRSRNCISIEKLAIMNGGFVNNGKIIIECYVRIVFERLEERKVNLQELRPNNQDIEHMFLEVPYEPIKKVIEMEIQLSQLTNSVPYSQPFYIDGIPFKVEIGKESDNWISIWLLCNQEDKSDWWRVNLVSEFRLINRNTNVKWNLLTIRSTFLERSNIKCGKNNWIKWDDFMDPKHVCVKHGRIVVEVVVDILGKYGFEETTGKGIKKPMKRLTDALILIDKKEFYVSRMMKYNKKYQNAEEWKKLFRDPDVIKLTDELRRDLVSDEFPSSEESDDEPFYLYSKSVRKISKTISNPRERLQKALNENHEIRMLLEDPDVQNLGNSFLSLLTENNIGQPAEPPSIQFSEFSAPSVMVTFNFKDNKIFYSSKQILANASHYFMKRYYGPDAKYDDNTIIFDEITSEDFNVLLNHVYHPTKPITEKNLDILLPLAHRFSFFEVLKKCEMYLIKNEKLTVGKKEEYANKYKLEVLLNACQNYNESNPPKQTWVSYYFPRFY
ncbi:hypothetical protein CAEBREN_20329 [Caenorhabditis brenneri]|uniref:BTB domain-containing protein n=1 Tax=Caenorhabditis brenneri TaxID=135651 RepID=G0MUL3_CAEBE|nr:hypothetical protein CAEBREN_20329 [Caenorhabditis brenneri]